MSATPDHEAVRTLAASVRALLPPPETWAVPDAHDSVGLALIDAVWSIGVRWQSARNVVDRYRAERRAAGADPDTDGPSDVRQFIEACGGPEPFAARVRNRQRTSTRNGILKAEAVLLEARILEGEGVRGPADLLAAEPERLDDLQRRWSIVPGQRSGVSWRAFAMLVGLAEVKPDRMIRRYVAAALGRAGESAVGVGEARALVMATAVEIGVSPRALDHAVWSHQAALGRPPGRG